MMKRTLPILRTSLFLFIFFWILISSQPNQAKPSDPGFNQTKTFQIYGAPDTTPVLRLRSGVFDPLSQAPDTNKELLRSEGQPGEGLHILQFPGPIQERWLEAVRARDLKIVAYIPDYGYLVWGDQAAIEQVQAQAPLRWNGSYQPLYVIHPALLSAESRAEPEIEVVIQIYNHPGAEESVQTILNGSVQVTGKPEKVLNFINLGVRLPQEALLDVAFLPDVVNVEPQPVFEMQDEIQGQILAGNLSADGSRPSQNGYLAWLLSKDLPTQPEAYPIVDVSDDGIDDGDTQPGQEDYYVAGSSANASRLEYNINWTAESSANGVGGHGNLNASIVAGYNDQSGFPYQDANGYRYGLGINPFGRVGGSKVFCNSGAWCLTSSSFGGLVSTNFGLGVRIGNNSWGAESYGGYTTTDQVFDALVRDAQAGVPGNQEMTFIFSAGNGGPNESSTLSPGNAKNVISVGAAESYRPSIYKDVCGFYASQADNAQDVVYFSSRGPTADGRIKPDIVAPGTRISGAASQDPAYDGSGVCGEYYPSGQTLYTWSTGTSHSAPAVSGAASLIYRYYQDHFGGQPPSPAMLKAYLIQSTRYLSGVGANDTLPSNSQGFGEVYLERAFTELPRIVEDQNFVLHGSGEAFAQSGIVVDSSQPLRVTLAWSEPPGVSFAAPYVNDLNLEVEIGGQIYYGNVFSGPNSTPGGVPDTRNNVESVFLPAGVSGTFQVRVRAQNIAGDGLPGNGDLTDQDFALLVYNAKELSGEMAGRVKDGSGNNLEEVTIQAVSASGVFSTTTGVDGNYRMTVPAGNYELGAWKNGYSYQTAADVAVLDGQTTRTDFTLHSVPLYTLDGQVTDQTTGAPLAATLTVRGPLGNVLEQAQTSQTDGAYRFDLYAGAYQIRAEARLHQTRTDSIDLSGSTRHDFSLSATTSEGLLFGSITNANNGNPVPGALIQTQPGFLSTHSEADGSYELQLAAGSYQVSVSAPYFGTQVENVVVPQSNLVRRDFALKSPSLDITPAAGLQARVHLGEMLTETLTLSNPGTGSLELQIYEKRPNAPNPAALNRDTAGTEYVMRDNTGDLGVLFNWIEASDGISTTVADDGAVNVNLPFDFQFYDVKSRQLRVANDGAILFGASSGEVSWVNSPLSSSGMIDLIAPFWDDLSEGKIYTKTLGSAPERQFVVEWFDRRRYGASGQGSGTFEVIFYEGSHNLKFQYLSTIFGDGRYDAGESATVGIAQDENSFLQYSYNQAALQNGLAICFQYPGSLPCDPGDIPWLEVSSMSASIPAGGSLPVQLTFDAGETSGLGPFEGQIGIYNNDPEFQPYFEYPVSMVMHDRVFMPFVFVEGR
jgi:hypothetical protein